MPVIGTPRSFFQKWKFQCEIDGVGRAGFSKISELSVEAAKIQHYEGGSLIPHTSPGRLTFADVTLERGATQDLDLFLWFSQVALAAANAGLPEPLFRRGVDIVQKDRDGSTLRRWRLHNAWPQKFVAGEWDNNADENVIESVTLTFDYFDPAP